MIRSRRPRGHRQGMTQVGKRFKAVLEALEGRSLLSTLFVDAQATGAETGTSLQPYHTIQKAIGNAAMSGTPDVVSIAPGTYREAIVVDRPVELRGPAVGTPGGAAIVVPPVNSPDAGRVILVEASNVTIDGLTIDGHSDTLDGGVSLNGISVNSASGISNVDTAGVGYAISGLTVRGNVLRNFTHFGILADGGDPGLSTSLSTGNTISGNTIDNVPIVGSAPIGTDQGRGISIEDNFYADVTNNVLTRVATGIQAIFHTIASGAGAGATSSIRGNEVHEIDRGILVYTQDADAPTFAITDNRVFAETGATATNVGIEVDRVLQTNTVTLSNNNVTGASIGLRFDYDATGQGITVTGGTLTGNGTGIVVTNAGVPESIKVPVGSQVQLVGVTVRNSTVSGFEIDDALGKPGAPVSLIVDAATTVTGSPHGAVLNGPGAHLADAGLPIVTFTSTPASLSRSSPPSFAFKASDNVTSPGDLLLGYVLDGKASVPTDTNGSLSLKGLADGPHTLVVQATDQAGNVGIATYRWTVNTVVVTGPTAPVLDASSDSGAPGDGITNDNTPTFVGTAAPGSKVTLFAGSRAVGSLVTPASGKWSITVASPLADGTYSFTATATDATGGPALSSAVTKVVIDTSTPKAYLSALALPRGIFDLPGVPVGFIGKVSDKPSGVVGASYTVRDASGHVIASGSIKLSPDGGFLGLVLLDLPNDQGAKGTTSYILTVTVKDVAGNVGQASSTLAIPKHG